MMLAGASHAWGAASAGYSEYYIPGDEEFMLDIFEECGTGGQGTTNHVTITVTAWSDTSTVYYDHWEDGYEFDPDDPDIRAKVSICREKLATAETGDGASESQVQDPEKQIERVKRLLEESGAESTWIMKYLFEEDGGEKESEAPW